MADSTAVSSAPLDNSRLILSGHAVMRFQQRHAKEMSYSEAAACLSRALAGGSFQRVPEVSGETWLCVFREAGLNLSFRFAVQHLEGGFLRVATVLPKVFDRKTAERNFKRMRKGSPTWKKHQHRPKSYVREERDDG